MRRMKHFTLFDHMSSGMSNALSGDKYMLLENRRDYPFFMENEKV